MTATIKGTLVIPLSDGMRCNIPMYYCASLTDIIVSPQHFTSPAIADHLFNGYCLIDLPRCCHILLSRSASNDAAFIDLHKSNTLYFISGSGRSSNGSSISRLTTQTQMLSELCYQRIGHPGPMQLSLLANRSICVPSKLAAGLHTMHSCQACQACNDGNIKLAPMGDTSDTVNLLPGTRFHLDLGFIRASSLDFDVTAGHHSVTCYGGHNTFLLIVCAKACHTWVFCQPSKAPPLHILKCFLEVNGLKDGPRFLCMDQCGKLWRSKLLHGVAAKSAYVIEPTGVDAGNENGKVEFSNGTFGVMVR
jgi:hypothetical protein